MKRAYKDEWDIIELASSISDEEVCFYPAESHLSHRFLASIRGESFRQRERPDFEDPAAALLLEAMMVDDHPRPDGKDRTRAREGELFRELKAAGLGVNPDGKFFALVSGGLPTDQDHNYHAYVKQFGRTVLAHGKKAAAYRKERPGFDLGFVIFDESTAYFEFHGQAEICGTGRPHFWFADSEFSHVIAQSNADCVMWLTPYKRLLTDENEILPLPTLTIVDVGLLDRVQHLVYEAESMVSSEA